MQFKIGGEKVKSANMAVYGKLFFERCGRQDGSFFGDDGLP